MAKRNVVKRYNRPLTIPVNMYNNGGDKPTWWEGFKSSFGYGANGAPEGMFDFKNTFSGANVGNMTKGLVGSIGGALGKGAQSLIGGGLESGAGNAIGSITGTVGSALSTVNPLLGGAVSLVGGAVGGLVNKAFGSKLNKENIAKVEGNIGQLKSFTSDVSDYDALAANFSSAPTMGYFSRKDIGKDGWFSNKAKKKYKELKKQADYATKWVDSSLANNAENIENNMAQNLEANYAAFGGPIGGMAISYELAKQDLANKELAALSKNKVTSLPNSFGPISTFAYGGQTHGADFSNGLTFINAGGTHEANPYEGVPMGVDPEGTPNLVEEGEVVWNDYVFSNRIQVPKDVRTKYRLKRKGSLTFADAAEAMAKENEERPNDPISQAGLEASLSNLMASQEELRAESGKVRGKQYAMGGNKKDGYDWTQFLATLAGYDKSKKAGNVAGKYAVDKGFTPDVATLEASPEYQAFTNYVLNNLNNPDVQNYLRVLDAGTVGAPKLFGADNKLVADAVDLYSSRRTDGLGGIYHFSAPILQSAAPEVVEPVATPTPEVVRDPRNIYHILDNGEYKEMSVADFASNPAYSRHARVDAKTYTDDTGATHMYYDPQEEVTLERKPEWMRYAPVVGLGIASLTDALGLTNKPDYSNADALLEATRNLGTYDQVKSSPIGNYLTYTPFDREFHTNNMRSSAAAGRRAIANTAGGNRANAVAGLLASDYNTLAQYGNLARQAEEYNLAQRQKVEDFNRATNMFNSESFLKADMANQSAASAARQLSLKGISTGYAMREAARNLADQAKSANLSGFLQALGDIGYENANRNMRAWNIENGTFGSMSQKQADNISAKGGKIKRRRKGLTY